MNYGLEQFFPNVISDMIFKYCGNAKHDEAVKELKNIMNEIGKDYPNSVYIDNYRTELIFEYLDEINNDKSRELKKFYRIIGNGKFDMNLFKHFMNSDNTRVHMDIILREYRFKTYDSDSDSDSD